jgi:hypothetical protein
MIRDTAGESAIELAARRLERAVCAVEQRLAKPADLAKSVSAGDLFEAEAAKARLASELERVKIRERELEFAGAEASAALGRAIQEIHAALSDADLSDVAPEEH